MSLLSDLEFGEQSEDTVISELTKLGFTEIEKTNKTSLTDFTFNKGKTKYCAELKTRSFEKNKYDDTMIGANKLAEAWSIYYKSGVRTLFLFRFTDGLYIYSPTEIYRTEFKAGRWDRGTIDQKKGWLYINTNELKDGSLR